MVKEEGLGRKWIICISGAASSVLPAVIVEMGVDGKNIKGGPWRLDLGSFSTPLVTEEVEAMCCLSWNLRRAIRG
jgi:hypothetical protein